MKLFLTFALSALSLFSQSNSLVLCDQQALAGCVTLAASSSATTPYTLTLSTTAPYSISTSGAVLLVINGVVVGTSNLIGDATGDLTLSGTTATLQVTGPNGGVNVTADTAFNSIQTVGGLSGTMLTANGAYIYQTSSLFGASGGYLDMELLSYPPASSGTCTDIWTNNVTFPAHTPQQAGGFGANDALMWEGPSPLYGASPSNCGPSPFINWNGTSGYQQVTNGVSFNTYVGALAGLASFDSAYNSIQSLTGGINVGTSVVSGQPFYPQGWLLSTSLLAPGSGFGNQITAATYASGGSATGTSGQYCALGPFNGGTSQAGAQGLITLAGTNTLAGATITFVNPISGALQGGQMYTSTPTQGVLNNGSQVVWPGHTPALCSGTATITSTISPIYYGAVGYKSGSVYWYWNGSAYASVDLSTVGGGGYWALTGAILAPTSATYSETLGTTAQASILQVWGAASTTAVLQVNQTGGLLTPFQVDGYGDASVGGSVNALGNATLSLAPYRVNGTTVIDSSRNGYFANVNGANLFPAAYPFASLPAFASGSGATVYCTDCLAVVGTCTGSGSGSLATKNSAGWQCY